MATTPHDLIRAIIDEDFVTAKQLTNDLLYQSAGDEIDSVKAEVANEIFDDCEECEGDDVSEGQMSANRYSGGTLPKGKPSTKAQRAKADFDKDGQVETPQAEVFGSHINAAVKSGKLSPEAAAKTKSKGKYGKVPARYNPKWMK